MSFVTCKIMFGLPHFVKAEWRSTTVQLGAIGTVKMKNKSAMFINNVSFMRTKQFIKFYVLWSM